MRQAPVVPRSMSPEEGLRPYWGLYIAITVCGCLCSTPATAGGPVHGARSVGMGSAFVGVADDPSAILINPGGMTQMEGTSLYGGITAVVLRTRFENEAGADEETDLQVFFPPHLYAVSDFGTERWRFGLGVYSPFGIGGRKWDDRGLTRYGSTESGIATLSANPTVAWQATPRVSLAFGLNYMWARNETRRMVDQSPLGAGDGEFELEGDGTGWGYNLGVLLGPWRSLRLGLAYRSRIEVDIRGQAKIRDIAPALQPVFGGSRFETDAETTLRFPEIYSLGLSWDPFEALTIAADVEWVRWSSFDRTFVDFANEVPEAGIVDGATTLDWKDSLQFKVGAELRPKAHLALRAGYAYIPTPVPEKTLEPGNPDADSHNLTLGGGYQWERVWVDAFYMAAIYKDRKVDNDTVSGEFENFAHFLGISLGYGF